MPNIFFTADMHISHANIIRHCNRPWVSIEEHDETLINNWNSVVSKKDMVYLLGDFAMIPKQTDGTPRMKLYRKLRLRLNGKIFLVIGNHDDMSNEVYDCIAEVSP